MSVDVFSHTLSFMPDNFLDESLVNFLFGEERDAGVSYPIYETTSTDERFSGFHISDLNTRLEVNMGNETVTIWIEEDAFEIVVKGLTEEEKESLKEVVDKEIRRIKYRRHKAETSNLRYVIDLNS